MNRLTLRFDDELEEQFINDYSQKSLMVNRIAILIGIFLYAVFGLLDPLIVPDVKATVWLIRYGIVCPVLVTAFLLTFSQKLNRKLQVLLPIYILIGGSGFIWMIAIAKPPGTYLYYAGLLLCIMYTYSFVRLRFLYAVSTCLLLVIGYVITVLLLGQTTTSFLMNNTFFLVAANVIGMPASYSIEFYIRSSFFQKRVIEQRTNELEEKNVELVNKNKELAQSRDELLRSAKRTELVFAALAEALPGTVLDDKYELEEKIGSGGFGTVYRATHLLLQHPVAVKVFRPSVGTDPIKNLERFRIEGVSASRVRHPNAVSVLDFGVSASSIAYMVMELLQGWTLKDELDEKEALSVARCIAILVPVCNALAEAHAANIVHRDIKPSNIFLHQTKEGETVKVVDFGIAKLVSDTLNPEFQSLTETGSLLGTPVYMSPERLSNKSYDGQADIYSLGVMMYEMLCGRLPFQSSKENYWSIVLMHMTHTPTSPRRINPEIPEKLEAIIMGALAKDPLQRPTAKQLGKLINEFANRGDDQFAERSSGAFRKQPQPNTTIRRASVSENRQIDQLSTSEKTLDETVILASKGQVQETQSKGEEATDNPSFPPPNSV